MKIVNNEPFDKLIIQLEAHGFLADAESLSSLKSSAWTSSSEMIGELGMAVLKIQSQKNAAYPFEISKLLGRCMKEVRKVWPNIRLP